MTIFDELCKLLGFLYEENTHIDGYTEDLNLGPFSTMRLINGKPPVKARQAERTWQKKHIVFTDPHIVIILESLLLDPERSARNHFFRELLGAGFEFYVWTGTLTRVASLEGLFNTLLLLEKTEKSELLKHGLKQFGSVNKFFCWDFFFSCKVIDLLDVDLIEEISLVQLKNRLASLATYISVSLLKRLPQSEQDQVLKQFANEKQIGAIFGGMQIDLQQWSSKIKNDPVNKSVMKVVLNAIHGYIEVQGRVRFKEDMLIEYQRFIVSRLHNDTNVLPKIELNVLQDCVVPSSVERLTVINSEAKIQFEDGVSNIKELAFFSCDIDYHMDALITQSAGLRSLFFVNCIFKTCYSTNQFPGLRSLIIMGPVDNLIKISLIKAALNLDALVLICCCENVPVTDHHPVPFDVLPLPSKLTRLTFAANDSLELLGALLARNPLLQSLCVRSTHSFDKFKINPESLSMLRNLRIENMGIPSQKNELDLRFFQAAKNCLQLYIVLSTGSKIIDVILPTLPLLRALFAGSNINVKNIANLTALLSLSVFRTFETLRPECNASEIVIRDATIFLLDMAARRTLEILQYNSNCDLPNRGFLIALSDNINLRALYLDVDLFSYLANRKDVSKIEQSLERMTNLKILGIANFKSQFFSDTAFDAIPEFTGALKMIKRLEFCGIVLDKKMFGLLRACSSCHALLLQNSCFDLSDFSQAGAKPLLQIKRIEICIVFPEHAQAFGAYIWLNIVAFLNSCCPQIKEIKVYILIGNAAVVGCEAGMDDPIKRTIVLNKISQILSEDGINLYKWLSNNVQTPKQNNSYKHLSFTCQHMFLWIPNNALMQILKHSIVITVVLLVLAGIKRCIR